jgi:hypothetical protein
MGLSNLSDKELLIILAKKGGLGEFLKDKDNLAKFIGLNSVTNRRVADVLKYNARMTVADIKKKIDEMAYVHSSVTDFF